jgi:protein-S-isoprenylcysteine O-methyltransferase Ste14
MSSVEALNANDITKVGVIVIVALVVVGALLSIVITAIVGRLIILAVVIVAGVFVWQQRTHVKDQINDCKLSVTFFGVHLDAPDSVKRACPPNS